MVKKVYLLKYRFKVPVFHFMPLILTRTPKEILYTAFLLQLILHRYLLLFRLRVYIKQHMVRLYNTQYCIKLVDHKLYDLYRTCTVWL